MKSDKQKTSSNQLFPTEEDHEMQLKALILTSEFIAID